MSDPDMIVEVLKTWMQISGARLESFWIPRQSSPRAIKLQEAFQCEVCLKRGKIIRGRSAHQTPSNSHLSAVDFCITVGKHEA